MASLLFEHVIVLMLENRSFDHLFGFLGVGEGLAAGSGKNSLAVGNQTKTFSTREGGDFVAVGQGPAHSLKETNVQLFGQTHPGNVSADSASLQGFVTSFRNALAFDLKRPPTDSELQQVMNCFDPVQLPVLSNLARNFVLCDHWFADVPGPTMPNRAFVHAATSQGFTDNARWNPQFTCPTIYDRINDAHGKFSWRVYYHDKNDVLELYPNVQSDSTHHVLFEGSFLPDVAADRLATYSFITPAFIGARNNAVNSMHAPADVRPAEKLVADVYDALRLHQNVWKKTLLIILFDEHGGYYDHVKPPAAVSPDGIPGHTNQPFLVPFDFDRLGLRVPAILVSPWFPAGVDSTVYSHSTIPGSMIEAFGLGKFLTQRDARAAKLTNRYLLARPNMQWRTDIPDVTIPVQPQPLDAMQREVLNGSVNLDPHPGNRNPLRTQDIQDLAQATQFMRTQVAKNLEHRIAARGRTDVTLDGMSAGNQLPSTFVSAARVSELQRSEHGEHHDNPVRHSGPLTRPRAGKKSKPRPRGRK